MFVARVGLLDAVVSDLHLQQQIDDVLQGHVEGMRPVPASPADVIARTVFRNSAQRVVQCVDAKLRPGAVLRLAHRRHHLLVHVGKERVVDLHGEARIDDRLVFLMQTVGEREQQCLLVGVVFVLGAGERGGGRHHRQERARGLVLCGGGLERRDVALHLRVVVGEGAVDDEAVAEPSAKA